MPSGISHMLLSQNISFDTDISYKPKLLYNTRFFQIGSIAPDFPYGSIADDKFLEDENHLANLFHFTAESQRVDQSPNIIPLRGLGLVKSIVQQPNAKARQTDALFWFLAGYASHVIADGICHPFVMDKVGRYEGANKAQHRALEIGLDVLLFKHFTSDSGKSIEASYAGKDIVINSFNERIHTDFILEHFKNLIELVYEYQVEAAEIRRWVSGISRLFSLATGKWPVWFRNLDATTPFVFREISNLEGKEGDYLFLRKPKFWNENFLNNAEISFVSDCLPLFNKLMSSFINKAYAFVYESGPALTNNELPAFSLDTGRTVNDPNNIVLKPMLWEAE